MTIFILCFLYNFNVLSGILNTDRSHLGPQVQGIVADSDHYVLLINSSSLTRFTMFDLVSNQFVGSVGVIDINHSLLSAD